MCDGKVLESVEQYECKHENIIDCILLQIFCIVF